MAEHRPLLAANWKMLSIAAFAIVNAVVKVLSSGSDSVFGIYASLPIAELIFFQYMISSILIYPMVAHSKTLVPKQYKFWHGARVGFAILGIFCWAQGIKLLPLGQCVALGFLSPIFTVLGAWLFLKEPMTSNRIYAICLSFIGALVITNPFDQLVQHTFQPASLLPIIGSICFAADKILNRFLSNKGEKALDLTFLLVFGVAPVALLLALPNWVTPSFEHIPLLIIMGLCSALSNFALTKSCALADVTFITPLGLFKFIINVGVGSLIFFEQSTNLTLWLGTSFVLISVTLLTNETAAVRKLASSNQ